jgi:hypothetical protein
MTYTGSGLSAGGVPLVAPSPGAPLVLANTTTAPVKPSSGTLSFKPAGVPLPVEVPINILGPGTCQVTTLITPMSCPTTGSGTTLPEQFTAARPDGGTSPIMPGETMLIKSEQTGKYCRVVQIGTQQQRQQILCDQDTPATASPFTYTGTSTGVAYNGQPFVNPGGGAPAYFGPSGSTPTPATLVAPPMATNTPLQIALTGQGFLRIDNATNYAYIGNGDGTSLPELFYVADAADPAASKLVKSGQKALLISAATGKYLRLAVFTGDPSNYVALAKGQTQQATTVSSRAQNGQPPPSRALRAARRRPPPATATRQPPPPVNVAARTRSSAAIVVPPRQRAAASVAAFASSSSSTIIWGVLGDQAGSSTATTFLYTITGLTFNGIPLRAKGQHFPLLWSNTSTLAGTSTMSISPGPGVAAAAAST